ncbi:MAG: tRNA uridine-5-carboxymethylaminomethyl(34) synthesis enzyme MnmG [Ignavibacteriae bacterium]|nr:tRNA uridine-5-carboxymethylaminomethyl(34) synthesis enzyme MnmG [Ignavibacteriota bacterium]
MRNKYDIIVIGGGHAGIEASSAAARMGFSVGLITLDTNAIGRMSCNPAIGGTAKGHLVKEVDALGGVMGELADKTGIQFKMLNKSKGPAVWSPRCQSDKDLYSKEAAYYLRNLDGLDIIQDMVKELVVEDYKETGKEFKYKTKGVKTELGNKINCKCVIITSGTFLNAIMHTGKEQTIGGRFGEKAATGLSECLQGLGFEIGRLKTGTPPRLHTDSIDFSKTEIQSGDKNPGPFSHKTSLENFPAQKQVDCFLTHTNEETHNILRTGFEDSPLFTGVIKGLGPRYCPSIEDKISRFSDKPRHQIFLEPETLDGHTVYMNGFSSSLPADIQLKAARTIPGLQNVEMVRQGYAVEYDFFPTHHIDLSLETKLVSGLFNAGQVNGTSGYEEAAGQGIIAGINAALKIKNEEPLILKRSDAYIGVLIDDLVIKCPDEPYRMFTSSAEYRLVLRQDNADIRLMKKGHSLGLIDKKYITCLEKKNELIYEGIKYLNSNTISPKNVNTLLIQKNSSTIYQNEFLSNLLKRNEISLPELLSLEVFSGTTILRKILENKEVLNQIEIAIKYAGYIKRQNEHIEHFNKNEDIRIPEDFKYEKINSLSSEALDKLKKIKPLSLGQATRIAGVRPSDISAILIYMRG